LKTREAYNVIVKRIEAKSRFYSRQKVAVLCPILGIYSLILLAFLFLKGYKKLMIKVGFAVLSGIFVLFYLLILSKILSMESEDNKVKEVAILRSNAAGPSSALKLPPRLQEKQNKRPGSSTINDSIPVDYGGAAACGVSPYTYTGGGAAADSGGDQEEW
jgi:hypothetical protein